MNGDTAIISNHLDDDQGSNSGSAYVYTRSGTTWTQHAKLLPSDVAGGDAFGFSVSASGDTAVIGSIVDDDNGVNSGSAYVYAPDTTPPVFSDVSDLTAEATGPTGAVVNYTAPTARDAVDGERPVTCTPESGSTFSLGATTVTCTASDNAGNTATTTFNITVQDTTPPLVDNVPDQTLETTDPDGAISTYTAPTSNDAVDGTGTADRLPASGATMPLGETTITCNATDAAGNTGATTFKGTVVDTTPPEFEAHPDMVFPATEPGAGLVTYEAPATFDIVDETGPATCTPISGTVLAVGEWTVTCTATDAAGNAAAPTTFTVTVTDQIDVRLELDNDGQVPVDAIAYGADITTSVLGWFPVEGANVTVTITHEIAGQPL